MSVPTVVLSEIAEVRLGRQRSPKNHAGTHMRPYVRAANVGWSGWRLEDVKTMNFTDQEMDTYRLQPGDLLLGEASGSASEVGKPALWEGQIDDCAFQNTLIRVRPTDASDSRYLLHYFRYCASTGQFARSSRGVGIFHLGSKALADWKVPLPPIEEQRRIAAVLDAADKLRTKRREAIAKLDALTQAIFIDMFGDSAASRVELSAVAEVQGGLQVTSRRRSLPREVPYLRVANVHRGRLDLEEVKTLLVTDRELERTLLHKDDLLVVEGHGNKGEIGRVARWDGSVEPCVHQNHLIRVRCEPTRAVARYVEAFMNSGRGRRSLLAAANTTSGLNTISTSDVRSVQLPIPPLCRQQRFADVLHDVDRQRDGLMASQSAVDKLFASLQQRAFRGEL